jgi:diacylglycerol kinase (ATP)
VTRAVIITNPAAARSDEAHLLAARRRLAEGGLSVEIARTQGPGDGERLARAALADGVELFIAHGGDGTAMDVAAALIGTEHPLGLLPAGTGNLLAGNLRIRRSWRTATEVILSRTPRPLDIGRLTTSEGIRHFAVACGAGFDAELMRDTASRHKRAFGMAAYVGTAVGLATSITRAQLKLEVDGIAHEAKAAVILIANCGELIPGLLQIRPDIRPDDGVFDVAILDAASLPGAARVLWRMLLRNPDAGGGITFLRATTVRVSAEPPLPAQADGEACGSTPLTVELLPRALHVLAPRGT